MGQLPLQELMDGLPGFGLDSRLDSRKLVPAGLPVSASVPPEHDAKTGNPLVNKGDCHNLSLSVTASPQSEDWRREGGCCARRRAHSGQFFAAGEEFGLLQCNAQDAIYFP